jgi:plasmid replication initiation protein
MANKISKQTIEKIGKIEKERNMKVYKADELLQKARFTLTITEQRLILYAITKIKPTDTAFTEYEFNLKDFYSVCGISGKESYTEIKKQCISLKSKAWWITVLDENGSEWESAVTWFNTLRTNKKSGKIRIKFHEDMMPYLLELSKQYEETGNYFTSYDFKYILPMKSIYSIRIYELLKSYQKNNKSWWFKFDKLKHILDCVNYEWYDFKRRVLEPGINEINKFTDLSIEYSTVKDGNKIDEIIFVMNEKDYLEKMKVKSLCSEELNGFNLSDKVLEEFSKQNN